MFIVYCDHERRGAARPVPCAELKPYPQLGDDMMILVGVKHIREAADPTMEVENIFLRKEDIRYVVGGVGALDAPVDAPVDETAGPDVEDKKAQVSPNDDKIDTKIIESNEVSSGGILQAVNKQRKGGIW